MKGDTVVPLIDSSLNCDNRVGHEGLAKLLKRSAHEHDGDFARKVFERDARIHVSGLCRAPLNLGQQARHRHLLTVIEVFVFKQSTNGDGRMLGKFKFESGKWMVGHVEPEHLALESELLALGPFGTNRNDMPRLLEFEHVTEQVDHSVSFVLLQAHRRINCLFVNLDERPSRRAHAVEGARLDERFDRLATRCCCRHLLEVVVKGGVRTFVETCSLDELNDIEADVANCPESESNVVTHSSKATIRFVDVGRQNLDTHASTLGQVQPEFVFAVAHAREQCRHKLGRIVCLEVRGPVAQNPVAGGVRLVEGVIGEGHEHFPQSGDGRLAVTVGLHAGTESLELLLELFFLLLAHHATQHIGLTERVVGDLLRGSHDLLLVHNQTVRSTQNLTQRIFEFGMNGVDFLQPVLAEGVIRVRVHAHWARAVQGNHGRDVLKVRRLKLTK